MNFKTTLKLLISATLHLTSFSSLAVIDFNESPMTENTLLETINTSQISKLDQVPALLPNGLLINFVLKHGLKIKGPRGHLVEHDVSQSSDPELPRVILFDERSGASLSYNGGGKNHKGEQQTHGERLDVLTFDHKHKQFKLNAITFTQHTPGHVGFDDLSQYKKNDQCLRCHGPHQRPIFSMYPDWPTFYGSDNDELLNQNKKQQRDEYKNYRQFLTEAGTNHPRYTPLYSESRLQKYFNRSLQWYPSFPYRPNLSGNIENPSRAFAYRPGLRMGILYNRLTAVQVAELIKTHRNYQEYKEYFLFNLLQCRWSSSQKANSWLKKVESEIQQKTQTRSGQLLDYRQNLALFGLRVNDVDIRYSYNHSGYKRKSQNDRARNVMDVGYINGGRYFNSYFDGSATMDELLSFQIYSDLINRNKLSRQLVTPRGLIAKYGRRTQRMKLDRAFFEQMDQFSKWIPIAYPRSLGSAHHREGYPRRFQQQHNRLCRELEKML